MRSSARMVRALAAMGAMGLSPLAAHAVGVYDNVPEAAGMSLIYDLEIPTSGLRFNTTGVPYLANNAGAITPGSFSRVGYYLELAGSADPTRPNGYVYVSFNTPTPDARRLGVPTIDTGVLQQIVSSMNVVSNVPGIVTGTNLATGNIEFWPSNYNQSNAIGIPGANAGTFDYGDGGASAGAGHASMQIHNHGAGQTLIGFSDFGGNNPGNNVELGIGNNTGAGSPDWTFSDSGANYTVKRLQVVVDAPFNVTGAAPAAPANVVALNPELAGYSLVYQKTIGTSGDLNTSGGAYNLDFDDAIAPGSFDRIGYVLELAGSTNPASPNGFVSVTFDANGFASDAHMIGIPTTGSDEFYQRMISDMNVVSNVAGVLSGTGLTGNVEFWPSNYGSNNNDRPDSPATANDNLFDFGDGANSITADGYGSMQIHNTLTGQTLFAFNRWGQGDAYDLGIGNSPTGNPDWTFRTNAGDYQTRNLYILVRQVQAAVPEPATLGLLALGAPMLAMRRRRG